MNYYKFEVAYDGTDYYGWQLQPNKPTIVHELQKAFLKVFNVEASMVGASRTDAGVHALGQVALCRTELDIDAQKMQFAWNNKLSHDIVIRSLEKVDQFYHPQKKVLQKTYWYHFCLDRPLPFMARYALYLRNHINIDKLEECLKIFVGTHDFRSFCTGDESGHGTVRRIDNMGVKHVPRFNAYQIEVKGPGFLRYMIRRIVGASLTVASKKHYSVDFLQQILSARNPLHTLPTALPHGLVLYNIRYT